MTARKTRAGWVIETTSTAYGMLRSGGVAGREELYRWATLAGVGLGRDADPDAYDLCADAPNVDWVAHHVQPDMLLRAGHVIR